MNQPRIYLKEERRRPMGYYALNTQTGNALGPYKRDSEAYRALVRWNCN